MRLVRCIHHHSKVDREKGERSDNISEGNTMWLPMTALSSTPIKTVWPSGLRRWLKAPVRKGVGSNPTAVSFPA